VHKKASGEGYMRVYQASSSDSVGLVLSPFLGPLQTGSPVQSKLFADHPCLISNNPVKSEDGAESWSSSSITH